MLLKDVNHIKRSQQGIDDVNNKLFVTLIVYLFFKKFELMFSKN